VGCGEVTTGITAGGGGGVGAFVVDATTSDGLFCEGVCLGRMLVSALAMSFVESVLVAATCGVGSGETF
jgi:hypothetical protein